MIDGSDRGGEYRGLEPASDVMARECDEVYQGSKCPLPDIYAE